MLAPRRAASWPWPAGSIWVSLAGDAGQVTGLGCRCNDMMRRPASHSILTALALALSGGLLTALTLHADSGSQPHPTVDAGSETPTGEPAVSDTAVPLDEPFVLAVGETAFAEYGVGITFASVLADSRCPADVECVWEGNAEVAIDVATDDEHASLSLNTNPDFATEASYLAYTLELIALEPYPRADVLTDEPYRVTLLIRATRVDSTPAPAASPAR